MRHSAFLLMAAAVVTACTTHKAETVAPPTDDAIVQAPQPRPLADKRAMPYAYIYKTNGDYNNNVIVGYDRATDKFTYYPAPTDVSALSAPLKLTDGWLLERQGGISLNTAFLKWTYTEYRALGTTPTLDELRAAILPDARVTVVERLDMTSMAAQTDTVKVNNFIKANLR